MSETHQILELRTSKDSLHSQEAAVQFLASIPELHDSFIYGLLNKKERLALEIIVENQSIYFQLHAPVRVITYLKSILIASYQEIVIKESVHDALEQFVTPVEHNHVVNTSTALTMGYFTLKNNEYLPLKTFRQFSETDPFAILLSTLSKADEYDRVALQYLISKGSDSWKNKAPNSGSEESSASLAGVRQKITQKINQNSLKVNIQLVVSSQTQAQSSQLTENIINAFAAFADEDANKLIFKKPWFFHDQFLKRIRNREPASWSSFHLSLDEAASVFHLPNKNLAHIPNIAWGKNLLGEPPEDLPVINKDMDPELKKEINAFAKVAHKNKEVVYGIKRGDRRRHMYVIGKTGTGKSTLLANMAINDLKNDEGICIIDPHGDLVETLLDYIPSRRMNDVIYFDPSDTEKTVKLNLFEGESIVHSELIASGIVSVFKKLYGYSWGPRLEYILRNALLTLLKTDQARLSDILELLTNKNFRKPIVESLDDPILKSFWVNEYDVLQEKQRTDSIASILNKVGQFVSSPIVRNIVNARKSSFSIEEVMNSGKILLVNLSQGRLGEDNATLLGAMLITKIQLAAMARVHIPEEERKDFYLYVDEFQNFATDSFTKILSEARKYRLNLLLANQYIAQIPEEVQKAIFGNCGSIVSFVMGADDSAAFSKEFGGIYTTEDLTSLSRYQVINRLSIDNIISRPFPAQTLSLASSRNANKEKVLRVSKERYSKTA